MYQRGSSIEYGAGPRAEVQTKLDNATRATRIERAMTLALDLPLGPKPILSVTEAAAMRWQLTVIRDNLNKMAANEPRNPIPARRP